MDYRREIDGLRALAIVPVILFHAGFQTFSGGFVGVDVFFVISGYLITSIILAELEQGTFSIANFYERRARRILPALFLVMLVCLPCAWLWLLPQDMKDFSHSLIAVTAFCSNILFWQSSGYFESAAELKPLLHTWSLAVEEQYYVLFPLFLLLAWRLGKPWILALLAVIFALSLGFAQYASTVTPEAAFYLLSARGWELLIGAFVAFYCANFANSRIPSGLGEAGGVLGLGLIVYAIFFFDSKIPFPSLYTLVPTLGAALIILCATQATLTGRLLGHSALVAIGLISYSAYLWHQPLFAFAKHSSLQEPSSTLMGSLVVLALIFAYFSWKYVELPFRQRGAINRKRVIVLSLVGSLGFASLGVAGHLSNGFEWRNGGARAGFLAYFENASPAWHYFFRVGIPQEFRIECDFFDIAKYRSGGSTRIPVESINSECYLRNTSTSHSVFVWGDSHAQQLYPGLKRMLSADWQLLQVASSGCEPKLNANPIPNKQDYCEYSNWFAQRSILVAKPDVVVVGQNLNHSLENMEQIANFLSSIGVRKVIFTGPSPHWTKELPKVVVELWDNIPRRTQLGVNSEVLALDKKLKDGFKSSSARKYVSIIDNFCNADGCLVYFGNNVQDGMTSWDYGHLSPLASKDFAKNVLAREILDSAK